MADLALDLFHLARLLAVMVDCAIAVERHAGLSRRHLKHMGLAVDLHFLFLDIAPRFLGLKTPRVHGSDAHVASRVHVARRLVVKHVVTFDGHRHGLVRIDRLSEVLRHFLRVVHQLQLFVGQTIFPLRAALVLNVVEHIRICVR